jgi:hypothetical protein
MHVPAPPGRSSVRGPATERDRGGAGRAPETAALVKMRVAREDDGVDPERGVAGELGHHLVGVADDRRPAARAGPADPVPEVGLDVAVVVGGRAELGLAAGPRGGGVERPGDRRRPDGRVKPRDEIGGGGPRLGLGPAHDGMHPVPEPRPTAAVVLAVVGHRASVEQPADDRHHLGGTAVADLAPERATPGRSLEMTLTANRPSNRWSRVANCRASCGGHCSPQRTVTSRRRRPSDGATAAAEAAVSIPRV